MEILLKKAATHSSLLIMITASAASFIVNIFLKEKSSDSVYASYAILLIFIGYANSLGLLASEHVLLRFSRIDTENTVLSACILKQITVSISLAALIFTIISLLLMPSINYPAVAAYSAVFLANIFFVLSASLLRLQSKFALSQISSNAWKLTFPFILFFIFTQDPTISESDLYFGITFSLAASSVLLILLLRPNNKSIKLSSETIARADLTQTQLGYLISLGFIAFANSYDKIYAKENFTTSEFSAYAFTFLMVMYPVSMLSSYFGFKEFVQVKAGKSVDLRKSVIKLALIGATIVIGNFCCIFLLKSYITILWDPALIVLMIILGAIKLPYSLCSAIIGAKASSATIFFANLASWAAVPIVFCALLMTNRSIASGLLFVVIVWACRLVIYLHSSRKTIEEFHGC